MKQPVFTLLFILMMVLGISACVSPTNPEVVDPETADTVATEITEATPEPAGEATVVTVETPAGEVESGTPAPDETVVPVATPTTVVRNTPESQATPATDIPEGVILVFRRDGGIAGFCDTLTVMTGSVTLESCSPNYPQGEMPLDPTIQARLLAIQEQYSSFTASQTDAPGAADAMTYTIEFNGTGTEAFTPDVQQELMMIGQELLDSFASQS